MSTSMNTKNRTTVNTTGNTGSLPKHGIPEHQLTYDCRQAQHKLQQARRRGRRKGLRRILLPFILALALILCAAAYEVTVGESSFVESVLSSG